MIRVFVQHGDRTDRKKARLKYLIDSWGSNGLGVERFLEETEKLLTFPLIRVPISECEPRRPIDRSAHLGIHPQSQSGLHYIGIAIPVGHLPAAQMRSLANIAEHFGTGELRLTVWQNLIIPNIPTEHLEVATQAIQNAGLDHNASTVLAGTVACTGNKGCRFATTDTKSHAVNLARHLDACFPILDQPINLHVTGCHHSCAQHYIGDIGLMGVKVSGEEGYQVLIGGGVDNDQGLARELISSIPFTDLAPKLESLFTAYTSQRHDGETFLHFTRRHDIAILQSFCNKESA
jgi:ferredoxin-nitrite reductase